METLFKLSKLERVSNVHHFLSDFIDKTQSEFLRIYKTLPILEKKFTQNNEEASAIINYFLYNLQKSENQGIVKLIEDNKQKFIDASKNFNEILEMDKVHYNEILTSTKKIRELNIYIDKIKKASNDIRVYSINSIIISAKSGEKGRGYSALSKFLIDYSQLANEITKDIFSFSLEISSLFEEYEKKIIVLQKFENTITDIKDEIELQFEKIIKSFKQFSSLFQDVISRTLETKKFIPQILSHIQLQDIFKQQLEHCLSLLDKLDKPQKLDFQSQSILDIYQIGYFEKVHKIMSLNKIQLLSIKASFKEMIDLIKSKLSHFHHSLDKIQLDKQTIVKFLIDQSHSDGSSILDKLFENFREVFDHQVLKFSKVKEEKIAIKEFGKELDNKVQEISLLFSRFEEFIQYLTHVNFLAKKEVSKWEIFKNSDISLTEGTIDELTHNIQNVLNEAVGFYENSKSHIHNTLFLFDKSLNDQSDIISSFTLINQKSSDSLKQAKNILKDTLLNLNHLTNSLKTELMTLINNMAGLESFYNEIEMVILSFDSISKETNNHKQALLHKLGVKDVLVNEYVKNEIYNEYTVDIERTNYYKFFQLKQIEEKTSNNFKFELF